MTGAQAMSVGRNDPCPCGSGKKYKQCCIDKQTSSAPPQPQPGRPVAADQKAAMALMYMQLAQQHTIAGNCAQAVEAATQALALDPNSAAAYYIRGMARHGIEQHDVMTEDFARAMALDSGNYVMLYQIATLYGHLNRYMEAIPIAHHIIELQPTFEEAWILLAECYYRIGKIETSKKMFDTLAQKFPNNPVVKVLRATFLPPIPFSNKEIDEVRAAFVKNLDALMAENFRLTKPEIQMRMFPFYHAYHGLNNVEMNSKLAEFCLKSCPSLNYTAPHCKKPPVKKPKLRIGFVSEFMHRITLNQFFLPIMQGMARDPELEIYVFSNSPLSNPTVKEVQTQVHKYVPLMGDLTASREAIAREEVDILIYLEIGMAHQTYFLACARLAPIQVVCGGHPVTTGIPTMDYFIAPTDMHSSDPQAEYTETPMLFKYGIVSFERPKISSAAPRTREELGLPSNGEHLYVCPVMLFKLHPDMDRIFEGILKRDPKGVIILFDPKTALWRAQLEQRFALNLGAELAARIIFVPFAEKDLFLDMLRVADAVLDSVHFSFGTTAYLTLGANVPFVTWPGEFLRGRAGEWMYQCMQMTDLIARTHEDFVDLVLRLANDKAFYADMQKKIQSCSDVLFNTPSAIDDLASRLKQVYAERIT